MYEDERQGLNPASEGPFGADDVAELTDREWLRDGACCREGIRELVEAIRNGSIFHEIALMKDIWPRWGDLNNNLIRIVGRD